MQLHGLLVLGMRTENAKAGGAARALRTLGAVLRFEFEPDLAVRLANEER